MSRCFLFQFRIVAILLALVLLPGCLFRSHKVEQPITGPVKTATQQELIDFVNSQAAKIQTMQAAADIDTNVGGAKKGKVIEYQQIRGYVLLRQPSMLRMVGLAPLVRNTAFDMVSDGQNFKLWIPSKSRFIVGRNDVVTHNLAQPLENLRPQHIYDALLIRAIDPQNEIAVLESDIHATTDAKGHPLQESDYILDVVRKGEHGWSLSRKIVFSRTDLLPYRQLLYDENGEVATNAVYRDHRLQDGINFPWQIEITRPQEEYDITLTMVKLQLNQPLPDEKFVLNQPPGAEVVHLDKSQSIEVQSPQSSH